MKQAAFIAVTASCLFAATTTTWELNGYQDFLRGRMGGLSLTRDGRLIAGPKLDTIFTSDQPEIWSIAHAADGSLYLGTGNGGRLYKIDAAGKSSLVWTADQPEIFAVTVDAKGLVYAGTSPDGKIYRIENGKAIEYFDPHARYIWALKFDSSGALYAATGDQGKIYKITAAGRGELYYDTGQAHVTCLAIDREGRLLAGSEPNGILYRVAAKDKAFVLYDANLPEIRAIVPAPDGSIYAAALGGSIAKRTGAATTTNTSDVITAPTISVTVTGDAQAGITPAPKPDAPKSTAASQPAVVQATTETAGVEKSAIYKIATDNTVETLWSSKDENAYDIALAGSEVMFLTDAQARIYRLDKDRKATLLAQGNEGEAMRVLESGGAFVIATGDLGKILRLGSNSSTGGWFESPVHDAGTVARWGRITWRGSATGVSFKTRSGNSLRPDATWSDWSPAIADLARSNVTSPNARYIQWRAEFSNASASIDSVTVAFLPQNTPPVIRSINVSSIAPAQKAAAANSSANAAYTVTVTDTGDTSTPAGTPSQTLGRSPNGLVQIVWQADDPDGDKLIFSLYFRGEDEREWKLIKANITDNTYLTDADVFADGRYWFKVTASDRLANALDLAREAELESAPVLIDNTPPLLTVSAPQRVNGTVQINVDAQDRGSDLRRCEYSIDAGPWQPVEAADGVTDSNRERFELRLSNLAAGEHLVVIRVYDAAGNAGLAKVVVH